MSDYTVRLVTYLYQVRYSSPLPLQLILKRLIDVFMYSASLK
jgi:hypothetical protein